MEGQHDLSEGAPAPRPGSRCENRADGTGAAPRRKFCGVWAKFFRGKPMSNMGEKHKSRGKAGKLSVVPILWEPQGETDVSTPHSRG